MIHYHTWFVIFVARALAVTLKFECRLPRAIKLSRKTRYHCVIASTMINHYNKKKKQLLKDFYRSNRK